MGEGLIVRVIMQLCFIRDSVLAILCGDVYLLLWCPFREIRSHKPPLLITPNYPTMSQQPNMFSKIFRRKDGTPAPLPPPGPAPILVRVPAKDWKKPNAIANPSPTITPMRLRKGAFEGDITASSTPLESGEKRKRRNTQLQGEHAEGGMITMPVNVETKGGDSHP